MRYPGEVYLLPPEALAGGDPKERPHVLLTHCSDSDCVCTVAYASTSPTETAWGAAHHLVNPGGAYRATGFDVPSYVYPSRLISLDTSELRRPVGRLLDDMVPIRDQLRYAVGLGTGTATGSGLARSSLRGMLVEFDQHFAADCCASFGVVVTEPLYSKQRRYELVVPFLDAREFETPRIEGVVSIAADAFTAADSVPYREGLLFVPLITTAFYPQNILRNLACCLSESAMRELDMALLIRFAL